MVSLRDFEEGKCDVIWKYTPDEVRMLVSYKEIDSQQNDDNEDDVEFGEDPDEFMEIDDI